MRPEGRRDSRQSGRRRERQIPLAVRRVARPIRSVVLAMAGSIRGVRTEEPIFALTFDDGPDAEQTPRILSILAAHGARATFFVIGDQAEALPWVIREIRTRGHEVAHHGQKHALLPGVRLREAIDIIHGGRRRLECVLGGKVRLFRPAFGAQSLPSYLIARLSGMHVVAWTADAKDWKERELEAYVESALKHLKPGSILLLHDYREPGRPADSLDRALLVDRVLAAAEGRGMRSVTVTELLGRGAAQRRLWFQSEPGPDGDAGIRPGLRTG